MMLALVIPISDLGGNGNVSNPIWGTWGGARPGWSPVDPGYGQGHPLPPHVGGGPIYPDRPGVWPQPPGPVDPGWVGGWPLPPHAGHPLPPAQGPVDPGYGQGTPIGGIARPPIYYPPPVDPGYGQGRPLPPHVGGGPIYPPNVVAPPIYLPPPPVVDESGTPVEGDWAYSPVYGWVYVPVSVGGGPATPPPSGNRPANPIAPTPEPKR